MNRSRPWVKAPLLLFKRPGVAIALATSTMVAVLPAAGTPLLLSASQSASMQQQFDDLCAEASGFEARTMLLGDMSVTDDGTVATRVLSGPTPEAVAELADQVEAEIAEIDGIGPVERTLTLGSPESSDGAPSYYLTDSNGRRESAFMVYRDGALDHIEPLSGDADAGVWIPDDLKIATDAGDIVSVTTTSNRDLFDQQMIRDEHGNIVPIEVEDTFTPGSEAVDADMPVAGTYRTLNRNESASKDWCYLQDMLQYDAMPENTWYPTVLVDEDNFWTMAGQWDAEVVVILRYELAGVPAVDEAGKIASELSGAVEALEVDRSAFVDQGQADDSVVTDASLPRFHDRATLVGDTLRLPVSVVSTAAVLIGLSIVAAGAVLWVRRRRIELAVLVGRGVSPGMLGVKGALEALPAVLIGGAVGYGLCRYSTQFWAPSAIPNRTASLWALVFTAVVMAVALLTMGVASARSITRFAEPAPTGRRRLARLLPWELVPAGAAVAAWMLMDDSTIATAGDAADRIGQVEQLPGRVFLVPLLAAATFAMLVARAARWWWGRTRRRPRGVSGFIAAARIRRDRMASAVMLAAITVPTALAGYAIVAAASVEATIDAQARSEIGAEMVVDFDEAAPILDEIAAVGTATPITRIDNLSLNRIQVSVLYVDVATFEQVSDTADLLAGADVTELLGRPGSDGAIPVVAGGSDLILDGIGTLKLPGSSEAEVDVAVVPDLPGKRGGHPVVLISDEYLPADLARVNSHQWWISTDDTAVVSAVIDAEYPEAGVRLASERYLGTPKQALVGSIDYLLWVSLLTAVVVVVGILLRLESRSAANRRAFVIMRRMGLARRAHWIALLREVGWLLTLGVACGTAISVGLIVMMGADFDVDGFRSPDTVLAVPVEAVAWLAAATLITALASAWLAHGRIAAAKPSEVLRDTG